MPESGEIRAENKPAEPDTFHEVVGKAMQIVCNGSSQDLPLGASVHQLLLQLQIEPRGLAVAVNDALVPRTRWESNVLQDGDRVTVIRASQGG